MSDVSDFLSGGGGGSVSYTPTPLDSGAQGLINAQHDRATQDTGTFIKNAQAPYENSPNLMNPRSTNEAGLGGNSLSGLGQAIYNRQAARLGDNMNQMKLSAQMKGIGDQFHQQSIAFNAEKAAQNIATRNNENVMKAEQANAAARAAVLKNILGVGGMIAGAAIGGPVGAGIGAQAAGLGGQPADWQKYSPVSDPSMNLGGYGFDQPNTIGDLHMGNPTSGSRSY